MKSSAFQNETQYKTQILIGSMTSGLTHQAHEDSIQFK